MWENNGRYKLLCQICGYSIYKGIEISWLKPVWLQVVNNSLQKIVGANDDIKLFKAEIASRILGPNENVYGR